MELERSSMRMAKGCWIWCVCEMYKEDVRVRMARIYENQQQIVYNVRGVVGK